ncbi:recombination protein RecR [Candidatus Gracilibacteria bacterium]|nr:MAG: recombination protein RecR [Candidatus Gracilibacteria bacterium]
MPKALQRLIDMIHYLPGIGEKTAAKLAFFLFQANTSYVKNFAEALIDVHENLIECTNCHGMTDKENPICTICSDVKRDQNMICVVEDYLDMISIERTGVYRGQYHILGGSISPIQGTTPDKLNIDTLFERVLAESEIDEIILATNPNIEGEATSLYITEHIPREIKISRLSKGLPHAGAIEYADEITLLSAFKGRG